MASKNHAASACPATLDESCAAAMQLQLAGRLDLAEKQYRAILEAAPSHPAANYCMGMLQVHVRRPTDALPFLLSALEADPQTPDYWLGYLEALSLSGRTAEALAALALGRRHGLAGSAVEDLAQRLESAARAAEDEDALLAALKDGEPRAALSRARSITQQHPQRGLAWKVLGALLWAEGCSDDALAAMQSSARLTPRDAEAHSNLGLTLARLNRFDEAERHLRNAIEADPGFATAHYRLGMTYFMQARLPEAEDSLRRGIALRADYATGDDALNYSNLLFILSHNAAIDADSLFAQHRRFGDFFENAACWPLHSNGRQPDRCLKVGFVSGDFREHAVAGFIEPVLHELRERADLELHAYCNCATEDHVSERIKRHVHRWHPVAALSDDALTAKILADHIDILIDLSGHTGLNRLPVFARKPAPIQASWIGYPGTTGLRAVDYFLADPHFLPPGDFDRHFTEKLVHLPVQTPFSPHASAPPVNSLPALACGRLTFGSFNRPDKINDATVGMWSHLLRALPDARMIVGAIPLEAQRTRLLDRFAACGIRRDRLVLHPPYDMETYLALYQHVDIALDTTPYNGGTTTLHALWMGVPTMTLAGPTPAARSGAAILGQLGLHAFIAKSSDEYLERGLYWAAHLQQLALLRSGLRERWVQSPGRRADVVARSFEAALRHMWKRWCANLPAASFAADGAIGVER